ncbi:MAG: hypothetical protein IPK64_16535 [bacterium]|nr:hypothetical protein [bacterium]
MNGFRHSHRCRLAGILALAVYLAGGLGPAGGALATLARDGHGARGACGCAEGDACCGAACCAPAATAPAALPDCCGPAVVDAAPSCCGNSGSHPAAHGHGPADGQAPFDGLALVARCTCGQRDHQSSFVHFLDAHVPALERAGICPPPVASLAPGGPATVTAWRPEPRDRVPKSSRPDA